MCTLANIAVEAGGTGVRFSRDCQSLCEPVSAIVQGQRWHHARASFGQKISGSSPLAKIDCPVFPIPVPSWIVLNFQFAIANVKFTQKPVQEYGPDGLHDEFHDYINGVSMRDLPRLRQWTGSLRLLRIQERETEARQAQMIPR